MGARKYFKREFQTEAFFLEHDSATDFHLSCWQNTRSVFPLLCLRTIIFLGCLATVISSMVIIAAVPSFSFGHWFIFLTHWGLLLITAASGFALAVSLRVFFYGTIDSTFGLPWYVKAYWAFYNIAIPIAFFITIFYWIFLTGATEEYAFDKTLDVFVHAINSVLMLVLVLCSRHPTRLLHFYMPLLLGIAYMLFSLIFYLAGGLSPFNTSYIYPMLDWSQPVMVTLTVVGSAIVIFVMHCLLVTISVGRDMLAKRFIDYGVFEIN